MRASRAPLTCACESSIACVQQELADLGNTAYAKNKGPPEISEGDKRKKRTADNIAYEQATQ
eukprot:m.82650 g.82650  ORF g.82650 m.82650 type:complete len:62 (+) comp50784_c0_seq1:258-443(+)